MRRGFLLATASLLPLVMAAEVSAQWPDAEEISATIEAWRAAWGVPGAAVAVVRGEDVLLLEGFGVRKLGATEAVGPTTLFELGSASKTFAATVAALASEGGGPALATPVVELMPELRLDDPWVERHLTLQDLLSHRSGLGRHDLLWLGGASRDRIVTALASQPLTAGFREGFGYSNVGYILAAEAVARELGAEWAEVVDVRIFEALGMEGGHVGDDDEAVDAATPHVQLGDSVLPARTPTTHVGPAGGLLASATDLVRWMRFHLEAEGAVKALREPVVRLPLQAFGAQYGRASSLAYGTGWFVSDYAGRPMVDHIGGQGGMVANVTLLPEEGIGVAVLTNHGDNLLPVAVTYRVLDRLLGLDEREWNDLLLDFWEPVRGMRQAIQDAPGGERVENAPLRLDPEAYAGSYLSPVYGETTVTAEEGELRLAYGDNLRGLLSHWHFDTFRVTWDDPMARAILGSGFASFHLDMAGRPSGLTWTGFQGERVEAERVRPEERAAGS